MEIQGGEMEIWREREGGREREGERERENTGEEMLTQRVVSEVRKVQVC